MANSKIDTTSIVKLDDTNYQVWKLQVSLLFRSSELWGVVNGSEVKPVARNPESPTPAEQAAITAWESKDLKAMTIIVTSVTVKKLNHVYACQTSKEMWDKFALVYSDNSQLNLNNMMTKLINYQMKEGESIVDMYSEIEELARNLELMGSKMS